MKRYAILLSILFFLPVLSFTQGLDVQSEIKKVTVFMTGAQVTREGNVTLFEGRNRLIFKGLSHLIDPATISMNAGNDVTVMSVKHSIDFLAEKKDEPRIKRLKDSISILDKTIEGIIVQFQILRQKEAYLSSNRKMETGSEHFNPVKFKELNTYYGEQYHALTRAKHELNDEYKKWVKRKWRYINELRSLENPESDETSTVEILVISSKKALVNLSLIYSVDGAGWIPSYDVKVNDLDKPLSIFYKANVAQNTGEDWTNVKLTFSNSDPARNNTLPHLPNYYINYIDPYAYTNFSNQMHEAAMQNMSLIKEKVITGKVLDSETGLPLPFAVVKTSYGKVAVTDRNGEFEAEVSESVTYVNIEYLGYRSTTHTLVNAQNIIYLSSTAISAYREVQKEEQMGISKSEDLAIMEMMMYDSIVAEGMLTYDWDFGDGEMTNKYKSGLYEVRLTKSSGRSKKEIVNLANPIENNVTIEFKMEEKYSVKSNGKPEILEMSQLLIPAQYEYYTVPKLEPSAFLMAHVMDWAQYKLLPGETNLYIGNTYIGKSELDVYYVSDTLKISLGRDPSVTVKREKIKEYSGRQLLGADNVDKRQFRISIMNNKNTAIEVVILDQVPVSSMKEISVDVNGLSGAEYNAETGEVRKRVAIKPGEIEVMEIKYTVKYPKDKLINIE